MQRKKGLFVCPSSIPGAIISYVQFSGFNSAQLEARREGTHDKTLGVANSLLMQIKFVGNLPSWSSAHSLAARQMEVIELAQFIDRARVLAAEARMT